MRTLLLALILTAQAGPALAFAPETVRADLQAHYPKTSENESTNPLLRVASILELTPSAGIFSSVYVPARYTKTGAGPSRLFFLPAQQYREPMIDLLRRALSKRLPASLPAARICSGDPAAFTDCCTDSPTIACMENDDTLSPETTFPGLGEPLYAATAMDLLALELASRASSLSLGEIKGQSLQPDTLYLMLGDDVGKPGQYLVVSLDAEVLGKLALLVHRLEAQVMQRKGKQSRLGKSLSCDGGKWKASNSSEDIKWMAGDAAVPLRGASTPSYYWLGLGQGSSGLVVMARESLVAAVPSSLHAFYGAHADALASCFGPEVRTQLDQNLMMLNVLKAKSVSAFFVAWLQLAGTMDVLSR